MKIAIKVISYIDEWLCLKLKRYKLFRICKIIGIKPYSWQKQFALGRSRFLNYPYARYSGKTTAVMLKLLMFSPEQFHMNAIACLYKDPDFTLSNPSCVYKYARRIIELIYKCNKVPQIPRVEDVDIILLAGSSSRSVLQNNGGVFYQNKKHEV